MTPAPTRIAIGTVVVTASSALDARRLTDRLPGAIERALASRAASPNPVAAPATQRIDGGTLPASTHGARHPDLARAVADRIVTVALQGGREVKP